MKKFLVYALLFIILFGFSNCEKKSRNILYDTKYKKEIEEARKEAAVYMALNHIPGASIAVAKEGKIIYSEGIGLASKDLEVYATRKTKFRIGEVSELFTALIYQMMIEDGTLHPDSSIQHYLPNYPESVYKDYRYKITINQLVSHSSGIRKPQFEDLIATENNYSLEKSIDNFKNEPLDFEPGVFESPSSINYNLLGAIMEKATGKRFPELLKTYITDTLQLTNTEVDNPFRTVTGRTDFFDFNLVAQVVNATFRDMRNRAPSDGILSNAEDLVKFGNAVLYSDAISKEIKDRLFVPGELLGEFPPTMANGWFVQKNRFDEFYYGKVGGVTGGGAVLLLIPAHKLVLAITVNITSDSEIPVFRLLAPFLPVTESEKENANPK